MSRLLAIIDEYKDRHGQPSDASIARAIAVSPATISAWRRRGLRELPDRQSLKELAALAGLDYETVVLPAVLADIGYLATEEPAASDEDEHRGTA